MLSPRDRLLAALFAVQLLAATVLGLFLVQGLRDRDTPVTTSQGLVTDGSTPAPGSTSGGTLGRPGTQGTQGSGPTTVRATPTPSAGPGVLPPAAVVPKGAPIKVGAIVTQTGAINFSASAQGTKAYLDRVNRQGGVNGRQVVLDLRDDQLDAARGRQQAQQLLAEGVFAFAGWNAPLTEETIVPFLEQNKVPLVGGYGTRPEYKSPYAFIYQSGHYGYEMGRFLAQEQRVTRPGVIFIGSSAAAANTAQRQAFTDGVAAGGKTLRSDDIAVVDVTKPSYDDVVTQFRTNGVDGIATLIDQTAYNRLQQAMDRQGWRPVHVADPLFTDPVVKQGSTTEGTLVASDFAFTEAAQPIAEVQDYISTVRAQFGSRAQISYLGLAGWIDAKVLVEALRRVGDDLTRPRLISVLESLPSDVAGSLTPPLRNGPAPHDINRCLQLGKVEDGRITPYKGYACDDKRYG